MKKENLALLSPLKSLTLLCVEDDKTTQLFYRSMFGESVKKIIIANDGREGYKKFKENEIDFILSDYSMPNCNGLEMITKIREEDKEIPIIFASAIDDLDIVAAALNLGVDRFVKKPIKKQSIMKAFEDSAKIVLANRTLQAEKEKEHYRTYQEKLGFAKELNILRNDFYYQMLETKNQIRFIDFIYLPLDVLSGDAYSARKIKNNQTFYLMVDGMGKGLSASLTAMTMTSFVNHVIDNMISVDSFNLHELITETIEYIKPILLEEESLAVDYIFIDDTQKIMHYAKFAMPVLLMEDRHESIQRIKSNNAALSKWQSSFKIDTYDIAKIKKFLIYSDGIVENETIYDKKSYGHYIEEDFLNAFNKEDLKASFSQKITNQEDDITCIFIQNIDRKNILESRKQFPSTLKGIDEAALWYESLLNDMVVEKKLFYSAEVVFSELFMNAYEHGNLGITFEEKHKLLEEDKYIEVLSQKEQKTKKEIGVSAFILKYRDKSFLITQITDTGNGFDTQVLSEIFRNSKMFNGRGVLLSRKNSSGIYYNLKGNSVLFVNKV